VHQHCPWLKQPKKGMIKQQLLDVVNFFLGLPTCLPNRRDYYGWKGMAPSRAGFQTGFGAYFGSILKEAYQTAGGFWPNRRRPHLSSFVGVRQSEGKIEMKKKIDISTVPELNTSVGMHGSVKQAEVGGPICLGLFVAVVIGV
jgi:hypothetical protein